MENTYLTKIPEIDMHILDHMSDESLIKYIQTSIYRNDLIKIPKINQRVEMYKKYKTFDLSAVITHNFDAIVIRPYILFRITDIVENLLYNVKIIYDNYYTKIDYSAIMDNYGYITIVSSRIDERINIVDDQDYEAKYGFDINTLYMIYVNQGFHKYAKKATQEYLDRQFDKMTSYKKTYKDFFNLMGLYLWFKINCIFLYLTKDTLRNIDSQEITIEYINSEEGEDTINKLKNYITLYYDLLSMYIENL